MYVLCILKNLVDDAKAHSLVFLIFLTVLELHFPKETQYFLGTSKLTSSVVIQLACPLTFSKKRMIFTRACKAYVFSSFYDRALWELLFILKHRAPAFRSFNLWNVTGSYPIRMECLFGPKTNSDRKPDSDQRKIRTQFWSSAQIISLINVIT